MDETGCLRQDKALPKIIDQFGWCTWMILQECLPRPGLPQGLETFRDGCTPKFLLLDDGWQSEHNDTWSTAPDSLRGNEKFPGDLVQPCV